MKVWTIVSPLLAIGASEAFAPPPTRFFSPRSVPLASSTANADFEKAVPVTSENGGSVDPNTYNVPLEKAAELWTVSVSAENSIDRKAGVPFLDSKSKDHYVDDVSFVVKRTGGMGMELLELAGGRDDGYGLTIIEGVSGNAEAAGILPGDSIASVEVRTSRQEKTSVEEKIGTFDCECRDFDATIEALTSIPSEIDSVILNVKRIRRWPKVQVTVEYPPSQCAEGADNTQKVELVAGENLRRALLNRGIVMEDALAGKCDFCGCKCSVKIEQGMPLLSPMSITEEKIMQRNPKCRISCKTVVGYNMQEGFVRLKVNLNEWTREDKKKSNPFFSR